jgi:hypothetical protein
MLLPTSDRLRADGMSNDVRLSLIAANSLSVSKGFLNCQLLQGQIKRGEEDKWEVEVNGFNYYNTKTGQIRLW